MDIDRDIAFDPVRCAELHNQLLAKSLSHIPGAIENAKQDIISTWLELPPDENRTDIEEGSPLYIFLSLIRRYNTPELLLIPEFEQPQPEWFDNPTCPGDPDGEGRSIILLYPKTLAYSGDYGLWFNLDTCLVIWGGWRLMLWPDGRVFPDDDEWVPLEFVLEKALEMWEIGKFYWGPGPYNPPRDGVLARPWIPTDLNKAIEQWELLIQAIQERIPDSARLPLQDPLSPELVEQYKISSFTKAFLCAAKRPPFTHVGPGITTFSPESFIRIYGAESANSNRIEASSEDDDEPSSLLLPAVLGPVPEQEPEAGKMFGKEYANHYRLMASRWPGLYTEMMTPPSHGDSVIIVTDEGVYNTVRWDNPRPWGSNTGNLPLHAMLCLWTDFVTDGIWEVNSEGVSMKNSWFWDPETEDHRRLMWLKEFY